MGDGKRITWFLCDAHVHFNMEANDPLQDLKKYFIENCVQNGVLIINRSEEYAVLTAALLQGRLPPEVACIMLGLNKNDLFFYHGRDLCTQFNKLVGVKLHPRLFHMQAEELPWYYKQIQAINPSTIIVDDFFLWKCGALFIFY